MSQSPIDLAALARALDVVRQDPKAAERIDAQLAKEGSDAWRDLAIGAAFHCQMSALGLMPWQSPPMYGDIDQPRLDRNANELLQRMLSAGLSRYESDPLHALERAEALREPVK